MKHERPIENSDDQLEGIAELASALGRGSSKLCQALSLIYGDGDMMSTRADLIDRQLQPLVTALNKNIRSMNQLFKVV